MKKHNSKCYAIRLKEETEKGIKQRLDNIHKGFYESPDYGRDRTSIHLCDLEELLGEIDALRIENRMYKSIMEAQQETIRQTRKK